MTVEASPCGGVLNDPPCSGSWNMAVDQRLLQIAETEKRAFLRFYRWEPATVSLGYFQQAAERTTHSASSGLNFVRRSTGGGAIVHHHELTYSFVVPGDNRWSREHHKLLLRMHGVISDVIAACSGIGVTLYGDAGRRPAARSRDPYLCFQRRTPEDLVSGEFKIVGSAQRRARRALLQHGSILLQRSPFAPELPGINNIARRIVVLEELQQALLPEMAGELGLRPSEAIAASPEWTGLCAESVVKIQQGQFDAASWTYRR